MKIIIEKPPIPHSELFRAFQVARLPHGEQKGTRTEVFSRRLAYNLRVAEAFVKAGAECSGIAQWDWINELMRDTIAKKDFKTLDSFCEAWMKYKRDMKPGQSSNRRIASAIMTLQETMDRAPTNGEIVSQAANDRTIFIHGPDIEYDLHSLKITCKAVSSFIESLGLGDCLSKAKTGRKD